MTDTDLTKHRYPGIAKAALELAYDNGGINIGRTEADCLQDLEKTLQAWSCRSDELVAIDAFLSSLSDDDLLTAVNGEETEMAAIMARGPATGPSLLDAIFDEAA